MAHEFRDGSGRLPLGSSLQQVADTRVSQNPNFRVAVSDNQWYIKQSIMYGINALVELMIDDTEELPS